MRANDPCELLLRFAPPRASEALRERTMSGARAAAASAIRPSRTDRIWYSGAWRLAWVGSLAALILLEALLARPAGHPGRPPASRPVGVPESAVAAEALGLPARPFIGERAAARGDSSDSETTEDL